MSSELSLQQKLRVDTQLRVEELEECVLEKEQEIISLKQIVSRLQGEVYARTHTHTRTYLAWSKIYTTLTLSGL